MTNSLRDQLLGLGFAPPPKPERKEPRDTPRRDERPRTGQRPEDRARNEQRRAPGGARPPGDRNAAPPAAARRGGAPGKPRTREEIDLAKAYAIRAQREKEERIAAEAAKQEEARKRREARARLSELIKDHALNIPDADIARHFPYGGKIKRVYVTADQLKALNAGQLGVLQNEGRYVLVSAEVLAQAKEIFPAAVALSVDPDAPAGDDPYADPKYQVPDDLVW